MMKSNNKFINILIREEIENLQIDEAAVSPKQASKEGLALMIQTGRPKMGYVGRTYTLYNPRQFLSNLEEAKRTGNSKNLSIFKLLGNEEWKEFIVGYIFTTYVSRGPHIDGFSYGAKQIKLSAAKSGYGPLLYDIVMSKEGKLMADRGVISKAARKVWKYYNQNRPDIEKLPLDNVENPKTPPEVDDGIYQTPKNLKNPLNWVYSTKRKVNVSSLLNNHNKCMQAVSKIYKGKNMIKKMAVLIDMAGDSFAEDQV